MCFEDYLRFWRRCAGATQSEIARRAKIRQGTYSAYETGKRRPADRVVKQLAGAINRPVEEVAARLGNVNVNDARM